MSSLPEVILKPDISDKAITDLVATLYSILPWSLWDQTAGSLAVLQQQLREANEASDRNAGEAVNAYSDLQDLRSQISEAIGTNEFLDLPDGGGPDLPEQVRRMRSALRDAIGRLDDMLKADDGQAWSETERMMPRLREWQ